MGSARMPTAIPGFDQLLDGGLPRERITLLVGGPGSGKTLFALQSLVNGARNWHEPGIFVGFEERADQLCADAASMGWDLPALRDRQLFFLDAHLPESVILGGEFDLVGLLSVLDAKGARHRRRQDRLRRNRHAAGSARQPGVGATRDPSPRRLDAPQPSVRDGDLQDGGHRAGHAQKR